MKKIVFILTVVTVGFTSCGNTKIDESVESVTPTGATVDKVETLSNADTTVVADSTKK